MMNEYTLPGIKLQDDKDCTGCNVLYFHENSQQFVCSALDIYLGTGHFGLARPDNCPLQPVPESIILPAGLDLNISNEPGVIVEVKPAPRCGGCLHFEKIKTRNDGEI